MKLGRRIVLVLLDLAVGFVLTAIAAAIQAVVELKFRSVTVPQAIFFAFCWFVNSVLCGIVISDIRKGGTPEMRRMILRTYMTYFGLVLAVVIMYLSLGMSTGIQHDVPVEGIVVMAMIIGGILARPASEEFFVQDPEKHNG